MRNMMIALTAVLVTALAVTDVMAQGRGGRGGFGGRGGGQMGALRLLTNEKVAEAIGLTDEQATEIREYSEEQRGSRPQRGNFRDMSDEERQAMRDQRAERQEAEEAKLAEILDEGQVKRLEEIKLQLLGVNALLLEEVQQKLGLTSETVTSLQDAAQKSREEMMSMIREGGRDGFREKAAEMREALEKDMLALLTSTEQEEFKAMQGEKLDISAQDLMGGRGGRGQGGPNARGDRGNRGERGQGRRPQRDGGSELE